MLSMPGIKEIEKLKPLTNVLSCKNIELEKAVKEWEYAFDAVSDLVYLVDVNYIVKYVNPALVNKLNVAKKDVIGKYCYDVIHPCDIDASGATRSSEYFNKLGGWFDYSRAPIHDDEKQLIGFICILRDITEQVLAEQALLHNEAKYRSVVEMANEGIVILQSEVIVYANPALGRMLGYDVKEEIGQPFIKYIHPSQRAESLSNHRNRLAGKDVASRSEKTLVHKNGTLIEVEIDVCLIEHENKPASLIIIRDVTERKKAEDVVIEKHKQLLSIFESIDEPVYVTDPDTDEILFANGKLRELVDDNDIIGKKCYKVLQNSSGPCGFCSNNKIFGDNLGKTYIWEFRNKVTNRLYHCIDKAIPWPNGKMVRYEMAIDISNRDVVEGRGCVNEDFNFRR